MFGDGQKTGLVGNGYAGVAAWQLWGSVLAFCSANIWVTSCGDQLGDCSRNLNHKMAACC